LAALASDGRALQLVPAPVPVSQLGREALSLFELLREALPAIQSFDRLPICMGPQVELSEAKAAPCNIEEVGVWLSTLLDRNRVQLPAARRTTDKTRQRGRQFFRTWGVHRWVKNRFEPARQWPTAQQRPKGLEAVTHWVEGKQRILLMEPILPGSDMALKRIATRALAYRETIRAISDTTDTRFVAYMLLGGSQAARDDAAGVLRQAVHQLVDLSVVQQRDDFVSSIRELGSTRELQI
jgi:hypothetical protein